MEGVARREGEEEQGAEFEGVGVLVNREGFLDADKRGRTRIFISGQVIWLVRFFMKLILSLVQINDLICTSHRVFRKGKVMKDILTAEIAQIRSDIPKINNLSDEYIFSLLCYKYFYNDGRLDYKDYLDCFVDGRSDGGIDVIAVSDDDQQVRLIFAQSKFINQITNKQDVVDIFTKMHQTFKDFGENRTAQYNSRLKKVFREKYSFVEDQIPIYELALFTTASPTIKRKEEIKRDIDTVEELQNYQVSIYYGDEIEAQIENLKTPHPFVEEGKIKIAKKDGYIKYGDNGLLVNVSANSLKDLYERFSSTGLFEQNFRYFIKNKRIDDGITQSLRSKRDQFWFMNNGIIIGCKDFHLDGDNVKLYDFSIINGCQTTTLIGEYGESNQGDDFWLPCKIVKPSHEKQFDSFISSIAEASNSQKPISDRDLKANKKEQKVLQVELQEEEPSIYFEIKRGETLLTPAKRKQLESWQYIKNDLYGQQILSFHIQMPGTARSGKKKIFADNSLYKAVFKRRFDKQGIVDLLKLNSYYDEFLDNLSLTDVTETSVAINGRFVILATIGFMLKVKRKKIDIKKISKEDEWSKEITADNLEGALFVKKLDDDFTTTLSGLFTDIIYEIKTLYDNREGEEKTVSNFFKTDYKYQHVILRHIVSRYYENPKKAKEREEYLKIFA